jgi:methylglyoxal/glyoxal reductase
MKGCKRKRYSKRRSIYHTGQVGYDSGLGAGEESLRRLSLTYVDLYLIHWPAQGIGNNTIEVLKAMVHLLREGKARAIGVSNLQSMILSIFSNTQLEHSSVNYSRCHGTILYEGLLSFSSSVYFAIE